MNGLEAGAWLAVCLMAGIWLGVNAQEFIQWVR